MLQEKFYWGTVRKAIVAFGNLFNNIYVDRKDENNNTVQTIKVPLAYSPKQKFLARIEALPTVESKSFQVVLPRMGFEMVGLFYDPQRRISYIQQNRATNNTNNTLHAQYAPTPYNINVNLYVYTKNQDDGLQVIEQILPYFNPDFNLTLNSIPELNLKNDLQILLDGVSYDDSYEADFSSRRAIVWTLTFTLKVNFYGPITKQPFIQRTTVSTFFDRAMTENVDRYEAVLNPATAKPGDSFTITESFEDF